jgi:hypothetical protein
MQEWPVLFEMRQKLEFGKNSSIRKRMGIFLMTPIFFTDVVIYNTKHFLTVPKVYCIFFMISATNTTCRYRESCSMAEEGGGEILMTALLTSMIFMDQVVCALLHKAKAVI